MTPHHFFCYIHPAGKLIWTYSLVLQVVHNVTAECVLGQHVSLLPLLGLACFDLHFHCHLLNQPDIYNYVYISHLLKKNNIISFNIFLKEIWDFFFWLILLFCWNFLNLVVWHMSLGYLLEWSVCFLPDVQLIKSDVSLTAGQIFRPAPVQNDYACWINCICISFS